MYPLPEWFQRWCKRAVRVGFVSACVGGTAWMQAPGQLDLFTIAGIWALGKILIVSALGGIFLDVQKNEKKWTGEERRSDSEDDRTYRSDEGTDRINNG